ncbi:uncharacterized protein BDZ99DRAFT_501424 [Mytilinidion resinicola]|uniref:Uncharacterized protein n=1 Tax=Mytilinidion resinicola TaxID=574789 RepID=A0A6A6YBE0_9PEZI|nr:uncharacterized protein BDZ99DRAFT_501424 [Mytilinidion resinicola]KAF2805823.1 hypothetical protein BDZ99DRAFT_501424 [Mytilinidion resinicola]
MPPAPMIIPPSTDPGSNSEKNEDELEEVESEEENEEEDESDEFSEINAFAIGSIAASAEFTSIPNPQISFPRNELKGHKLIDFPLSRDHVQCLINISHQAPFGQGTRTIVDTSARNTWEINAHDFEIINPRWSFFTDDVVLPKVFDKLGETGGRELNYAELYKMFLYEEGAMFRKQKDTEKVPGMFGTLVIVLPSQHEGGDVEVTHKVGPNPSAAQIEGDSKELRKTFALWQEQVTRGMAGFESLVYLLDHEYTGASLSLGNLKHMDLFKVRVSEEVCKRTRFQIYLSSIERIITGEPVYAKYYEWEYAHSRQGRGVHCPPGRFHTIQNTDQTSMKLKRVVTLDGKNIATDVDADEKLVSGHDEVVVIVPRQKLMAFLLRPFKAGFQFKRDIETPLDQTLPADKENRQLALDVRQLAIFVTGKNVEITELAIQMRADPALRRRNLGLVPPPFPNAAISKIIQTCVANELVRSPPLLTQCVSAVIGLIPQDIMALVAGLPKVLAFDSVRVVVLPVLRDNISFAVSFVNSLFHVAERGEISDITPLRVLGNLQVDILANFDLQSKPIIDPSQGLQNPSMGGKALAELLYLCIRYSNNNAVASLLEKIRLQTRTMIRPVDLLSIILPFLKETPAWRPYPVPPLSSVRQQRRHSQTREPYLAQFWEAHPLSLGYVEVIKDVMSGESLQSLEISNRYPEDTSIIQGFSGFQQLDWPTHLTQLSLGGMRFSGNGLTQILKGNAATLRTLIFQDLILEELEDSWALILRQIQQIPLTSLNLGQLYQFLPYSITEPIWGYTDRERQQLSVGGEAEVSMALATTVASFQAVAYEMPGWREWNWPRDGGYGARYNNFLPSHLTQHIWDIFSKIGFLRSYWTTECGVLVRFPVVEGAKVAEVEDRMEE